MFWDSLWQAMLLVITPLNSLSILLGTLVGIIVGAIPGVGPALGVALALPFTFQMDTLLALLFLVSLYDGAMYGGSISSILINTPGDGSAAATTLEGFPMARQGKAMTALSITATASALGGFIGDIIAIFVSIFMIPVLLLFGTPEYFLIAILGIILVSLVAQGAFYKGLISGVLGLTLTVIGIAHVSTADVRFTFNSLALYDGIHFLPVLLGLFGVATMAQLSGESKQHISQIESLGGSRIEGVLITLRHWKSLIKSSIIGFIIGSIPGTGGTVANFISYGEAVRSSKNRDAFGKGNPVGLIATESANNAQIDGALLPTLLFGIPGSATTALVLAAMLLHGLRPGAGLFTGDGYVITLSLFLGLLYSEIMIIAFGLGTVRILGMITKIDKHLIIPFVIITAMLGIFSLHFNWLDLIVMAGSGILGFIMQKYGYPIIPAVLGVILGGIIEENLMRTINLGGGNLSLLVTRPVSLILLILIVASIITPFAAGLLKNIKKG
ncbi:MAG: tripartite tricarboxylate transporter permease [Deltaproteobacteria bacterium]|nr:tripartite tricarboxylate transporter permease [Deltaproteobacteria bacterium]